MENESDLNNFFIYSLDPDVVEAMRPWKEIIDTEGSHVIGSTKVFLDASNSACRKGECNFGNLITSAFVDEVANLTIKCMCLFYNTGTGQTSQIQHPWDQTGTRSENFLNRLWSIYYDIETPNYTIIM